MTSSKSWVYTYVSSGEKGTCPFSLPWTSNNELVTEINLIVWLMTLCISVLSFEVGSCGLVGTSRFSSFFHNLARNDGVSCPSLGGQSCLVLVLVGGSNLACDFLACSSLKCNNYCSTSKRLASDHVPCTYFSNNKNHITTETRSSRWH